MAAKFRNKYRIESARLRNWDYGSQASYFVTVCTQKRKHYFGKIINGEMILNRIGQILESEWYKTLEIRPDMNLELGAFVIMPNHFHAIIIIGNNEYNGGIRNLKTGDIGDGDIDRVDIDGVDIDRGRDAMHRVSTMPSSSPSTPPPSSPSSFGPQSKNLASIMRGLKSAVKKQAIMIQADFAWQERFHDHIIRSTEAFERIQTYIENNPKNWKEDTFHSK